jgi:hypothetical protein
VTLKGSDSEINIAGKIDNLPKNAINKNYQL